MAVVVALAACRAPTPPADAEVAPPPSVVVTQIDAAPPVVLEPRDLVSVVVTRVSPVEIGVKAGELEVALEARADGFLGCFREGIFFGGKPTPVTVSFELGEDGRAAAARADGDRVTADCVVRLVDALTLPRPASTTRVEARVEYDPAPAFVVPDPVGTPTVTLALAGTDDPARVRRALGRRKAELRACVPVDGDGTITTHVTVLDGRTVAVRWAGMDRAANECVGAVVRDVTFPDGRLTLAFRFSRDGSLAVIEPGRFGAPTPLAPGTYRARGDLRIHHADIPYAMEVLSEDTSRWLAELTFAENGTFTACFLAVQVSTVSASKYAPGGERYERDDFTLEHALAGTWSADGTVEVALYSNRCDEPPTNDPGGSVSLACTGLGASRVGCEVSGPWAQLYEDTMAPPMGPADEPYVVAGAGPGIAVQVSIERRVMSASDIDVKVDEREVAPTRAEVERVR